MSFLSSSLFELPDRKIAQTQTIPVLDSVRLPSRALQPCFTSDSTTNSPRIYTTKPSKSQLTREPKTGKIHTIREYLPNDSQMQTSHRQDRRPRGRRRVC